MNTKTESEAIRTIRNSPYLLQSVARVCGVQTHVVSSWIQEIPRKYWPEIGRVIGAQIVEDAQ